MSDKICEKKTKTVGILGGMGPYASCAFLQMILNNTPAVKDSDHLHVVLDSNPHIPSRTRAVLYEEESPLGGMVDACRRLAAYPVDVIALPCNSAAAWLEPLKELVDTPILDIIEITTNKLSEASSPPISIAVWGGYVTYKKETYRRRIEEKGYRYFKHDETVQRQIENFIQEIKLNRLSHALFHDINGLGTRFMVDMETDYIILGCTEFGCLEPKIFKFPCINSLSDYAEYIVNYAKS
jgi:aspartate racemase